jgi:hypothetical protein
MKNFKIVLVMLPFLCLSCSEETADQMKGTHAGNYGARGAATEAANPANTYDRAGRIHDEILEALQDYDFKGHSVAGIAHIVDSTVAMHPEIGPAPSPFSVSERVHEITALANGSTSLGDVVGASTLRAEAKVSILELAHSLQLLGDDSYEDIREAIMSYEAGVLASSAFDIREKETMLTATSVVRYSVRRKKRKDKDWETSVSIAAAVSGEQERIFSRIKMAVAVTLCRENGIPK